MYITSRIFLLFTHELTPQLLNIMCIRNQIVELLSLQHWPWLPWRRLVDLAKMLASLKLPFYSSYSGSLAIIIVLFTCHSDGWYETAGLLIGAESGGQRKRSGNERYTYSVLFCVVQFSAFKVLIWDTDHSSWCYPLLRIVCFIGHESAYIYLEKNVSDILMRI